MPRACEPTHDSFLGGMLWFFHLAVAVVVRLQHHGTFAPPRRISALNEGGLHHFYLSEGDTVEVIEWANDRMTLFDKAITVRRLLTWTEEISANVTFDVMDLGDQLAVIAAGAPVH